MPSTKTTAASVKAIFDEAPFVQALGIDFVSGGGGYCETQLRINQSHKQQHGFIHAGVLMSMADHTCGGAAVSMVSPDSDVITVETKMSFFRPACGDDICCHAQVLRAGKRIIFTEAEVVAGPAGCRTVVAKMSSTLAVIQKNSSERTQHSE